MKLDPICITKQKIIFENEGERFWEENDWWHPIYKPMPSAWCYSLYLCLSFFLFFLSLLCVCNCSLFCISLLFFSFACWRLFLFIGKFEKLFPPFLFLNWPVNGQFHGPLSFLRAHAITHFSAFWFVLFLEFSFHRY